jgi:tRNA(adenine34) deaminase
MMAGSGAIELADEEYMREALRAARRGGAAGEVPVGAVIVVAGRVIARAHNEPIARHDATAHAEVLAIREAGQVMGNYRLPGSRLYVTAEPCVMCCGAIVGARIERVIYGAPDPKAGAVESLYRVLADGRLNHQPRVTRGVLAGECAEVLREFFSGRRI